MPSAQGLSRWGRRSRERRCLRGTSTLLIAALVALMSLVDAPSALGHAQLITTQPQAGAVLESAPDRVALLFNEPVGVPGEGVRLLDAAGEPIDDITARPEGERVDLELPSDLAEGTYTLVWRVISADTHPVDGAFVFHVGAPTPGGVAAPDSLGPPAWVEPAFTALRVVDFILILLVAGGLFSLVVVLGGAPDGPAFALRRALGLAALGLVPVALAGMALQSLAVTGALDGAGLRTVLDSSFAAPWLARGLLGAVVGSLLLVTPPRRSGVRERSAAIAAGILVALPALAGHARPFGAAAIAADIAHVAGAAVWAGGLAVLFAALILSRGSRWELAAVAVPRFSAIALVSVAVLVVAGVYSSWVQLGSWAALFSGAYGALLLAKVALLMALIALAAWSNRVAVPRLRARSASPAVRRRFMVFCGAELAVLATVIALTGVLVTQTPPRTEGSGPVHAQHGPDGGEVTIGPYRLAVQVDPSAVGANRIELRLSSADGPTPGPAELRVDAGLPSADVPPIDLSVDRLEGANALISQAEFPLAGDWELRVRARFGEFEQHTTTIVIPITQEKNNAPSHNTDHDHGGHARPHTSGHGPRDGKPE